MTYRIGNSKHLHTIGRTVETACPACGEKVTMQVFSNEDYRFALRFPPVEISDVCFAVCPNCAGVHQIAVEDVETRRTADGKKETVVTQFQLGALQDFD